MKEKRMFVATQQARKLLPAWLSPFLALVFVFFGQVIGGILTGVVLVPILLAAMGSSLLGKDILQVIGDLPMQMQDLFLLFELASFPLIAILVFLWVRGIELRPVITLGFYKEKWWKELLKGIGLGLGLFTLVLLVLTLLGVYRLESVDFHPYAIGFVALIFPFWLLQGGTEELVTRGWLLPVMAARSNRMLAILVSSSLFGLLHVFNQGFSVLAFGNLVLFGLLMAVYMLKTDNIWGVAGIHAAWNFAQGNLFGILVSGQVAGTSLTRFLPQSGPEWLTGGDFGVEGSLVSSLILLSLLIYLLYSLRREG